MSYATPIKFRTIRADELDVDLVRAWRLLTTQVSGFDSPAFCPEFTLAASRARSDVRIVIAESAGMPVAFLPMQTGPCRSGRPVGGALSDFHGVIGRPGEGWSPHGLLSAARLSAWRFDHLVDPLGLFSSIKRVERASPTVCLKDGYDAYIKSRRAAGTDFVPKTEGLSRKLEREVGPLEFRLHDDSEEAIGQLIEWKRRQYAMTGVPDVFERSWTTSLLRAISAVQTPDFAGQCSTLRAGGQLIAVHFGMRSATTMHYWFPAYDEANAKFSPGTILFLRMVKALSESGVTTIDLGKGDSPYKRRLMTGARTIYEGVVTNRSLYAAYVHLRAGASEIAAQAQPRSIRTWPMRLMARMERSARFT